MKICIGLLTYNNSESELNRFIRAYEIACNNLPANVEPLLVCIDNGEPSSISTNVTRFVHLPPIGNHGFGKSMNHMMEYGFAKENCDVFFTTNPDGFYHHQALRCLVEALEKYPDSILEALQFPCEHPRKYDWKTFDCSWVSGCCMAIPRKIYESIGGFDENFFMYQEDVDISWCARAAGFKVKVVPDALYSHSKVGRPITKWHFEQFYKAGRYLGKKWKRPEFQKWCEKKLIKDFQYDPLNLPPIPEPPPISSRAAKLVPTFRNELSFSDIRW